MLSPSYVMVEFGLEFGYLFPISVTLNQGLCGDSAELPGENCNFNIGYGPLCGLVALVEPS